MVTATADEDEACRQRAAMVDSLRPAAPLPDLVVQAMRTVPRERFLSGVPLPLDVYSDGYGIDRALLGARTSALELQPRHRAPEPVARH